MNDENYHALMSPQPTVIVRSLAKDPNYVKCPRCWHYTHEGVHNYDNLCDRCCQVLITHWPSHASVSHIMKKYGEYKNK